MDFPFYRSQQRPKPYVGNFRIPVRHEEVEAKPATGSRKVVQIPVHFVGSKSGPDRSKSASKIQKVFRGFLVRKSMRKIMAIKKEVDEIEARVWRSEEVELLEKDGKERLKVNEMLMALLFRLDSVRGVDSGVRDCRKSVIRKAIALQERVDAIAAAAAAAAAATAASSSADVDLVERESETLAEEKDHQSECQVLGIKEVAPAAATGNSVGKFDGSEDQIPQNYDNVVDFGNNGSGQGTEERNSGGADKEPTCEDKFPDDLVNYEESGAQNCDRGDDVGADLEMSAKEDNCVEDVEMVDAGIDSEMTVDVGACLENVKNQNCCEVQVVVSITQDNGEDMCERTPALSGRVDESLETSQMEDVAGAKEGNEERKYEGDDNKRSRPLLERVRRRMRK